MYVYKNRKFSGFQNQIKIRRCNENYYTCMMQGGAAASVTIKVLQSFDARTEC